MIIKITVIHLMLFITRKYTTQLTPPSNLLMQKYIHFIQVTFTSVDMQPFASKGIL